MITDLTQDKISLYESVLHKDVKICLRKFKILNLINKVEYTLDDLGISIFDDEVFFNGKRLNGKFKLSSINRYYRKKQRLFKWLDISIKKRGGKLGFNYLTDTYTIADFNNEVLMYKVTTNNKVSMKNEFLDKTQSVFYYDKSEMKVLMRAYMKKVINEYEN